MLITICLLYVHCLELNKGLIYIEAFYSSNRSKSPKLTQNVPHSHLKAINQSSSTNTFHWLSSMISHYPLVSISLPCTPALIKPQVFPRYGQFGKYFWHYLIWISPTKVKMIGEFCSIAAIISTNPLTLIYLSIRQQIMGLLRVSSNGCCAGQRAEALLQLLACLQYRRSQPWPKLYSAKWAGKTQSQRSFCECRTIKSSEILPISFRKWFQWVHFLLLNFIQFYNNCRWLTTLECPI